MSICKSDFDPNTIPLLRETAIDFYNIVDESGIGFEPDEQCEFLGPQNPAFCTINRNSSGIYYSIRFTLYRNENKVMLIYREWYMPNSADNDIYMKEMEAKIGTDYSEIVARIVKIYNPSPQNAIR